MRRTSRSFARKPPATRSSSNSTTGALDPTARPVRHFPRPRQDPAESSFDMARMNDAELMLRKLLSEDDFATFWAEWRTRRSRSSTASSTTSWSITGLSGENRAGSRTSGPVRRSHRARPRAPHAVPAPRLLRRHRSPGYPRQPRRRVRPHVHHLHRRSDRPRRRPLRSHQGPDRANAACRRRCSRKPARSHSSKAIHEVLQSIAFYNTGRPGRPKITKIPRPKTAADIAARQRAWRDPPGNRGGAALRAPRRVRPDGRRARG
jgi:hypothetical protein